jgi:hypothetical protein
MADIKTITATAKEYVVPIDNTIKETVVIEPVIQGSISEPLVQGQLSDPAFEVILSNYGEDSPVEPILFKFNEDFSSTSETIRFAPNKITYESLTSSEVNLKTVGKRVPDSVTITNPIYLKVSKLVPEIATTSETYLSLFGKERNDSSIASELFSRTVVFNRVITDHVYPTDDVFGEADIDDEQYAFVGKNLTDSPITSEIFLTVNTFNRVLTETGTTSELFVNSISKNVALETSTTSELFTRTLVFDRRIPEIVTSSELFSRIVSFNPTFLEKPISSDLVNTLVTFNRTIISPAILTEDILFSIGHGRNIPDSTTISETFSSIVLFNRGISNTSISSDTTTFNVAFDRIPLDNVNTGELFAISNFNKQLTDSVNISDSRVLLPIFGIIQDDIVYAKDDVLGEASIDDEQYAFVGKTFDTEVLTAIERIYLSTSKLLLENPLTVESGSIYNQGYFAGAYVTPGYVGQIRVF